MPEWGAGEVIAAEGITHEGKPCQRLTLRFARAGLKTISTAFAELIPATGPKVSAEPEYSGVRTSTEPETRTLDLAKVMDASNVEEAMMKLPEAATDPFLSLRKRLSATLALYKKGESASGLLDWAAVQTGLKDPMSRFNRHELEQWYGRFKMEVDQHLKKLVRDAYKAEPGLVEELRAGASPSARDALRRADIGR